MKMVFNTKRLWLVISAMLIVVLCVMCFIACDSDRDTHTHSYSSYVYNNDATCGSDGTETAKCKYCDKTDTRKSVSPHATGQHNYKEYVCLSCGDIKPDAPYTEGLEYTEIKDNEQTVGYSVSGRGDTGYNKYIKIPSEYNGFPVTAINNEAFMGSSMLCVMIPNSVTGIGKGAFLGCYMLNKVYMSNAVTYIGEMAFDSCTKLTSIEIPNSVTSMGHDVFVGCWRLLLNEYKNGLYLGNAGNPYHALISIKNESVSTIELNDNTKVVSDWVFNGCWRLKSIKMSNSIITIGSRAFYMCRELKSINMPNPLETIGEHAFFACMSLTSITIPNSVTSIGKYAFLGCDNLTSVEMHNNVTNIGESVFGDCSNLKNIKYNGTKNQWNAISKQGWDNSSSIKTIVCTDGTITL